MLRKFLFPLFKERHRFLIDCQWFRLLVALYVGVLLVSPLYGMFRLITPQYEACEARAVQFYGSREEAVRTGAFVRCYELEWTFGWNVRTLSFALGAVLVVHYLLQGIFFRVVMDFVVLGGHSPPKS